MWHLDLFLFCASEEQKWEQNCLLFVSLLVGEIYFPFVFLLIDFFLLWMHRLSFCLANFLFSWSYFKVHRSSSPIWDSNPSFSMHVVNMLPWSVSSFICGVFQHWAFLIFTCQVGCFSLWCSWSVASIAKTFLFWFFFNSCTSIVSVFVFTSPEIYFCVGRNVSLYIFQMGNQSSCICWIQTQLSSNAELPAYRILSVALTINSRVPSTMF